MVDRNQSVSKKKSATAKSKNAGRKCQRLTGAIGAPGVLGLAGAHLLA